jgi:hypothetical protein
MSVIEKVSADSGPVAKGILAERAKVSKPARKNHIQARLSRKG